VTRTPTPSLTVSTPTKEWVLDIYEEIRTQNKERYEESGISDHWIELETIWLEIIRLHDTWTDVCQVVIEKLVGTIEDLRYWLGPASECVTLWNQALQIQRAACPA
jgi:hypothetical protein